MSLSYYESGAKCGCAKTHNCTCNKCTELKSQISEIRRQLDAFQLLSDGNPHVSSSLLIDTVRRIIDNSYEEDEKNSENEKDYDAKSLKETEAEVENHLSMFPRMGRLKGKIHMEPHGHIESNWQQVVSSFDEMELEPALLRGVYAYGFQHPSAIQQRLIIPAIRGWDVIAQAPAETGRTSAVVIAVLQHIDRSNPHCQALFLTLTSTAALKIRMLVLGLGAYLGISCHTCHLGHDDDLLKMKEGRQIVIGTPNDVSRMINNRTICTQDVRILVIDDGEKLLSEEFRDSTFGVMKALDVETQVVVMSLSMTQELVERTKKFMRYPVTIFVHDEAKHQRTLHGFKEFFVEVDAEDRKLSSLCKLYEKMGTKQAIIFCNTTKKIEWLSKRMREQNYFVSAIEGNFGAEDREIILKEFESRTLPILVGTCEPRFEEWSLNENPDADIPVVIIYDFPINPKSYIQRCWFGRRFGGGGIAISFITPEDKRVFQAVQIALGSKIEPLPEKLSLCLETV